MNKIWHIRGSLLSVSSKEVLSSLISDDKKNYEKIEKEFNDDLKILDDALTLYIKSMQGAYSVQETWRNQSKFEAPIIMFSSVLNFLLLIRHSILLGYFPETPTLFRSCNERITRGYLFWQNEDEAKKYLYGEKIEQKEVDERLSTVLAQRSSEEKEIYSALRGLYGHESKMSHPNLESFKLRYGDLADDKLKESIINTTIWGGLLSDDLIKPVIYSALQITLRAISILRLIFVDSSGSYEKEYTVILDKYKGYLESVRPKS